MTLPRLWTFLAVALPTLAAAIASMSTVDLAYHLRAGSMIVAGGIPAVDSWTFTVAGQPWFDQQWGAQVVLASVSETAGWTGLWLLRLAATGAIFAALLIVARAAGLSARSASLLTLAAFVVAAPALALRPQLFGMALFALVLVLLAVRRRHPRLVWLIPAVVLAWANLHGSFFLGPFAVGLAWLADLDARVARRHTLLLVAVLSAIAACITPFGPGVWSYAATLSVDPTVTGRISEWQRTSPFDVAGFLFYASVAAMVVLVVRRRTALRWPTVLWIVAFALIGAYAVRGIAWWALAAVPTAAVLIASPTGVPRGPVLGTRAMRALNVVLAAALIFIVFAYAPDWRPLDPATRTRVGLLVDAPLGVTAAVRALAAPGDRVFAPQAWGSWFEYALPDLPVAVDSRVELFPAEVWADYDAVVAGTGDWQSILDRWRVVIVVTTQAEKALADRLTAAGWPPVHSDDDGTVFEAPPR